MDCSKAEITDGTLPSFLNERMRRAKKSHICIECKSRIDAGEIYEYICGIWEGKFHQFKTCNTCRSIRETFFNLYVYGRVLSDFYDVFLEGEPLVPENCIIKLIPAAKEYVFKEIENQWEKRKIELCR